jgi:hypothetical protein
MKKTLAITLSLLALTSVASAHQNGKQEGPQNTGATEPERVAEGWVRAGGGQGHAPDDYQLLVDTSTAHGGKASVSIKAKTSATGRGFETVAQAIRADEYRGRRVRLSGYLKTEGVEGAAGFWMRVDGEGGAMLAFDNMSDRPATGTSDWKRYEVIL